ncbi:MAG: GNAT family N-acetyltransferase [Solirubrobacterales bacterium]
MPQELLVRRARPQDAEAIARIHNQGIAERTATFQTANRDSSEIAAKIGRGRVMLVAERAGRVVGWAALARYADAHHYYATVAETTVYVDHDVRRAGVGRSLLEGLADEGAARGHHKLVGKLFTSNQPSIALVKACGWREVGVHRRHGRLDGEWRDVLVVELLIGEGLERP